MEESSLFGWKRRLLPPRTGLQTSAAVQWKSTEKAVNCVPEDKSIIMDVSYLRVNF